MSYHPSQVCVHTCVGVFMCRSVAFVVSQLRENIIEFEEGLMEALMMFSISGDYLYVLSKFRYFLAVQDEFGDK